MDYVTEAKSLTNERSRLVNAERQLLDAIPNGGTPNASQRNELDRYASDIAAAEHRLQDIHGREQREHEGDQLRALTGQVFGSTAPAGPSIGAQLRDAIGDVMDGKSTAFVELPTMRDALYESGSAGDGVPLQIKNPVATLTANSVVMSLPGIRHESMTSDRAVFPRIGAATAAGTAEGATLTAADSQVDSVTVTAQKFSTYELLSSELAEDASNGALDAFSANMLKHLALRVDLGLLAGDGASDIVGIREAAGANSTSVAGTPSNFADFRTAEYELRVDDADPRVWVMHPRTWNTLAGIKTGISSDETTLLEADPQQGPKRLLGFPTSFSTQITLVEGATNVGSWAALLDTSQLVICERRPARLEVSRDFKFDEDKIAVRATWRGGLAVLNPEAISLLTDIRA